MDPLQELRDKRAKAIADARTIREIAAKEKRLTTAEEREQIDRALAEAQQYGKEIDQEERLRVEERVLVTSAGVEVGKGDQGDPVTRDGGPSKELRERANRAIRSWITRQGGHDMKPEELRALQIDIDTAGGHLVPGEQFVASLIKSVDDMVFMRQFATVVPVPNADSLGVPSLDNDPADAEWTGEILTGSEDSTMSFGKRELKPHPLAKRIKVSNTLIRKAALDPVALVTNRLAYKIAIPQENAFLNGTGSNQPLGVFTASASGVTTARDVDTGNTTTAMTAAGAIAAKYSIKAAYWPRLRWILHRDVALDLALEVDTNGAYVWRESARAGEPPRLLDIPVHMSEYAPNTKTAALYVAILGDFAAGYMIADSLGMTIQRLDELYAETNQTGFISRSETDGMPVLAEAFARVQLAAS